MRRSLLSLCENFIENRDIVKAAFPFDYIYSYAVCAAIFTAKRELTDIDTLQRCFDMLRAKTSGFSNFRGIVKPIAVSMLAADAEPNGLLDNTIMAYDEFKKHFFGSPYLAFTSAITANLAEPIKLSKIAERARRIFDLMKRNHPLLTSGEDCTLAALLALTGMTDEHIDTEIERCYELLKPEFPFGYAVQPLSHILTLSERMAEEKCNRALSLYNMLKDRGYKLGVGYEVAMLGVITLLSKPDDEIVNDIGETYEYLCGEKGYGFFGIGKKQRLIHSMLLVVMEHNENACKPLLGNVEFSRAIPLIVAQQIAISIMMASQNAS